MKNKLFILLAFCLLLCGCGNYRELNDLSIVTGVAIDKNDDGYRLSFLIANSQKAQTSSKEGEAQTTVYSGTGENLTAAVKAIDAKSSKQLYYGHINVVVISEEVGKDGFLKIADTLLRDPETRKQFNILQAKDSTAEEILKIVSPLETFPSQNIAELIKSNQVTQSFSAEVNYSLFVGKIVDEGSEPILPTIEINGDAEKGSKQKNIESTEPETYLKLGSLAVYREDKFLGYLTKNQSQDVNILNNNINEFMYNFKYNNDLISYTTDNIKTEINVVSPTKVEVNVKSHGFISEANSKLNFENSKTIDNLQKNINASIKKGLENTLKILQTDYRSDIIGFGNRIYKKYPNQWRKMENEWNEKYFPKLDININTDVKIEATGALDQTIREVKK